MRNYLNSVKKSMVNGKMVVKYKKPRKTLRGENSTAAVRKRRLSMQAESFICGYGLEMLPNSLFCFILQEFVQLKKKCRNL